jgi:hypothetical protein
MNRKITLLPLALSAALLLAGCAGQTVSSSSSAASSASSTSSSAQASSSSSSSVVADHENIKDIDKEGEHTIKAVIVGLTETGMLLDDGTGRITTFYSGHKYITDDGYALGDYVKVVETFTKTVNFRYGSYGFSKAAVISKLDKTKAPTLDKTAVAYTGAQITTWFNAMKAGASGSEGDVISGGLTNRPLVTFDAKIVVSGTYVNWVAEGFAFDGGTSVNVGTDANKLANWDKDNAEKVYTLTGYLYENVAQAHAYIWLTGMSDVKTNPALTAVELEVPTEGKVAATMSLTPTVKSYAPTLAVTPALADFTWTSDTPTVATVDENGVITGVAKGTAKVTYVHKTLTTMTKTFDITVTEVPSVEIPATGIVLNATSIAGLSAEGKGLNSITVPTNTYNSYVQNSELPIEGKLNGLDVIVGSKVGTAETKTGNIGYTASPLTKTELGTDDDLVAIRKSVRVLGFKAPIKAASTVTIVAYSTRESQEAKYLPTVTLGEEKVTMTSPSLDTATSTYLGTKVGELSAYKYEFVFDVSACANQYLEVIAGDGTFGCTSITVAKAA